MSLFFAFEALKIYKIRTERAVQLLFLILLSVHIWLIFNPIGDPDFTKLNKFFTSNVWQETLETGNVPQLASLISPGNYIFLAGQMFLHVLGIIAGWIYIALYFRMPKYADKESKNTIVSDQQETSDGDVLANEATLSLAKTGEAEMAKTGAHLTTGFKIGKLCRLAGYLVITVAVFLISPFLFMLPIIIFLIYTYYTAPYIIFYNYSLPKAMRASAGAVRTHLGLVTLASLILFFLANMCQTLLTDFLTTDSWLKLSGSFFVVLTTLARGRLKAVLFLDFCRPALIAIGGYRNIINPELMINSLVRRERYGLTWSVYKTMHEVPNLVHTAEGLTLNIKSSLGKQEDKSKKGDDN